MGTLVLARRPPTGSPGPRLPAPPKPSVGEPVAAPGVRARPPTGAVVQPAMRVGAVNDPAEQEADRIADTVMRMPAATAQHETDTAERDEDEGTIARTPETIHRKCTACESTPGATPIEEEDSGTIARKASAEAGVSSSARAVPTVTPGIRQGIERVQRFGGTRLSAETRGFFEPRFDRSLSHVRVHADSSSASLAQRLDARAFTIGRDVFFGRGEYQPATTPGRQLLAHELVHTMQQAPDLAHPERAGTSPRLAQASLVQREANDGDESLENVLDRKVKALLEDSVLFLGGAHALFRKHSPDLARALVGVGAPYLQRVSKILNSGQRLMTNEAIEILDEFSVVVSFVAGVVPIVTGDGAAMAEQLGKDAAKATRKISQVRREAKALGETLAGIAELETATDVLAESSMSEIELAKVRSQAQGLQTLPGDLGRRFAGIEKRAEKRIEGKAATPAPTFTALDEARSIADLARHDRERAARRIVGLLRRGVANAGAVREALIMIQNDPDGEGVADIIENVALGLGRNLRRVVRGLGATNDGRAVREFLAKSGPRELGLTIEMLADPATALGVLQSMPRPDRGAAIRRAVGMLGIQGLTRVKADAEGESLLVEMYLEIFEEFEPENVRPGDQILGALAPARGLSAEPASARLPVIDGNALLVRRTSGGLRVKLESPDDETLNALGIAASTRTELGQLGVFLPFTSTVTLVGADEGGPVERRVASLKLVELHARGSQSFLAAVATAVKEGGAEIREELGGAARKALLGVVGRIEAAKKAFFRRVKTFVRETFSGTPGVRDTIEGGLVFVEDVVDVQLGMASAVIGLQAGVATGALDIALSVGEMAIAVLAAIERAIEKIARGEGEDLLVEAGRFVDRLAELPAALQGAYEKWKKEYDAAGDTQKSFLIAELTGRIIAEIAADVLTGAAAARAAATGRRAVVLGEKAAAKLPGDVVPTHGRALGPPIKVDGRDVPRVDIPKLADELGADAPRVQDEFFEALDAGELDGPIGTRVDLGGGHSARKVDALSWCISSPGPVCFEVVDGTVRTLPSSAATELGEATIEGAEAIATAGATRLHPEYLKHVERLKDVDGVDFSRLNEGLKHGDAILQHGPLQTPIYLDKPHTLKNGMLRMAGTGDRPTAQVRRTFKGVVDFVILEDRGTFKLVLGRNHSGLARGRANVFGAGELHIDNSGKVFKIKNQSGHYEPSAENLARSRQLLRDRGFLDGSERVELSE